MNFVDLYKNNRLSLYTITDEALIRKKKENKTADTD